MTSCVTVHSALLGKADVRRCNDPGHLRALEISNIENGKLYTGPLCAKQLDVNKKYEGIFSSVLAHVNAKSCDELLREQAEKDGFNYVPIDVLYLADKNAYRCWACRKEVLGHMELHRHICLDHTGKKYEKCHLCYKTYDELRSKYVCPICYDFCIHLDNHMQIHYAFLNQNAITCSICSMTFASLRQLGTHKKFLHVVAPERNYRCPECNLRFLRRACRDYHIFTHFASILDTIFIKIGEMQDVFSVNILSNQCPLCFCMTCSRKSMRLHIINKHLLSDVKMVDLLAAKGNDDEFNRLRDIVTSGVLNKEPWHKPKKTAATQCNVKQEIVDDDNVDSTEDKGNSRKRWSSENIKQECDCEAHDCAEQEIGEEDLRMNSENITVDLKKVKREPEIEDDAAMHAQRAGPSHSADN